MPLVPFGVDGFHRNACVSGVSGPVRSACYLTGGVDAVPIAVGSTQRSQVVHRAAGAAGRRWFPQKCVSGGVTGREGLACHLTAGVEAIPKAVCSAQRSQVGLRAARAVRRGWFPKKSVVGGVSGRVGSACHLTAGVEARPKTFCSTQRSQVGDGVRSGVRCGRDRQGERRKHDDAINGSILCHECVFHFWSAVQSKSHRPRRANRAPRRCRAGEELASR